MINSVHPARVLAVALLFTAFWSAGSGAQVKDSHSASGNITVVSLSPPVYPPMARVANIWGDVKITVSVRADGALEAVAAIDGHPILSQAALDSARQSRFTCRGCTMPETFGMLYSFRMVDGDNCCSAMNVPPMIELLSQLGSADDKWETQVIVKAQKFCTCDPAFKITHTKVRSLKCLYLWKCSSR